MGLKKISVKLEKYMAKINRICNVVANFTLVCMMLLVVVDVFGRYIIKKPITGSTEIIELMLVIIVFLSLANTESVNGNVSVDVIYSLLPKTIKGLLDKITIITGIFIFTIITWRMFFRAWESSFEDPGPVTSMLMIPEAPFMMVAAIGAFLLFVQLFQKLFLIFSHSK